MLYKDTIRNVVAIHPHLSRVWIKTEDTRRPLKGVWINESKLHCAEQQPCTHGHHAEGEAAELTEDHLAWAA
jgi:hypothetical protein